MLTNFFKWLFWPIIKLLKIIDCYLDDLIEAVFDTSDRESDI